MHQSLLGHHNRAEALPQHQTRTLDSGTPCPLPLSIRPTAVGDTNATTSASTQSTLQKTCRPARNPGTTLRQRHLRQQSQPKTTSHLQSKRLPHQLSDSDIQSDQVQLIHATLSPETLPVTVKGTKTVTIPLFFIISSVPHVCVHGGVLISEAAVNGSSRKYSALFCSMLDSTSHA